MNDPATGRFALYDEAPGGGDFDDPNSMRNRPLNDPENWLHLIYFHSDFNYLEVIVGPTVIGVSHSAIGVSSPPVGASINFGWNNAVTDRLLYTHSLGYAPLVMAVQGSNMLWPGMPVQVTGDGGVRFVSIYSTATEVRMKEYASTGTSTVPAIDIDYTLLIFADPPAPSGNILYDFNPVDGVVQMGRGKFRSDRRYLQVVPGGSPYLMTYGGKTIDLANGAPRFIQPNGSPVESVPSAMALALPRIGFTGTNFGWIYGSSMAYNGSYSGPSNIQVQAP